MTTITCQYTGIQFEAKSTRTKNHPDISAMLAEAQKHGQYGVAIDAIHEIRDAGVSDIETFVSMVRDALKSERSVYMTRVAEWKRERETRIAETMDYQINRRWLDRSDNQGELETEADRREVNQKMASIRTSED